ncbi:MAG: hypothetical protein DI523_36705 [Paraburkholderia fungorum]|nr:MAG: hypothetical protein DI523_36705 [Paraburkholderia fungorum]
MPARREGAFAALFVVGPVLWLCFVSGLFWGWSFGLLVFPCFVCGLFGFGVGLLAFPCFLIGLLALPLCGAALTFFAAAKKVSKESGSNR